jgi:hypothetical protein
MNQQMANPRPRLRAHRTPGRHTHWRLARHRGRLLRGGALATLLAVVGPGLLAGLSNDDPAGITTYSILGADYGYLPFMRSLGRERELMGEHALGRAGRGTTGLALGVIAVAVVALAVLALA